MSGWDGRRVLVTGAAGFIGSHVLDALIGAGAGVTGLVRYSSRSADGGRGAGRRAEADLRHGDVRDPDTVMRAAAGCATVIHMAAEVSVPYSYRAPRTVVETNVLGTLNVLLAARAHEVERVVCVSSSEVYGTPERVPIRETDRLNAQSPYAASKVAADMLVASFHRSYEMPVGLVRPFNVYGPRQSARAVIPAIVTQALAGGPVRLGSLWPARDFTYVDDAVAGVLAFAELDGAAGTTVQLGSGSAVTVEELVRLVQEILGTELDVRTDEARVRPEASEVERLVADAGEAERLLGWRPRVALRDGLERTIQWAREGAPSA